MRIKASAKITIFIGNDNKPGSKMHPWAMIKGQGTVCAGFPARCQLAVMCSDQLRRLLLGHAPNGDGGTRGVLIDGNTILIHLGVQPVGLEAVGIGTD